MQDCFMVESFAAKVIYKQKSIREVPQQLLFWDKNSTAFSFLFTKEHSWNYSIHLLTV